MHMQEGEGFTIGLWRITETVEFFRQQISYKSSASNTGIYLQQMASRLLLNQLSPGFPFEKIVLNESGKPIFPKHTKHFSLSHTKGYAAAIIAEGAPVGIDVELISERVLKVEHKFLNDQERGLLSKFDAEGRIKFATLCWSIKETVYKCWGMGGVDFSSDINIVDIPGDDQGTTSVQFFKNDSRNQMVGYRLFGDLWLTYMIDSPK